MSEKAQISHTEFQGVNTEWIRGVLYALKLWVELRQTKPPPHIKVSLGVWLPIGAAGYHWLAPFISKFL